MFSYSIMVKAAMANIAEIEFNGCKMFIFFKDGTKAVYKYEMVEGGLTNV